MRRLVHLMLATLVLTPLGAMSVEAGSKPRKTKEEEASAFERYLASRPGAPEIRQQPVFVQPSNKTEPCKLPSTATQINRPHFRAYWDGECKNGFAYGLGRDIAISDTHHIEEISVHNGTGENWAGPHVIYDFVENSVTYLVGGALYPSGTAYRERMENRLNGFNQISQLIVQDNVGNRWAITTSPFNPEKRLLATEGYDAVGYAVIDTKAMPVLNPDTANLVFAVTDPRNISSDAVSIASYPEGETRNFMRRAGQLEAVVLPKSYTEHLQAKINRLYGVLDWGKANLAAASGMEREYLHKACEGNVSVKGLPQVQYRKICNWRGQFQQAYAVAQANYQRQLAVMNQQAQANSQQRLAAAQLRLQATVAAQQANAQSDMAYAVQGLSNTLQSMQIQSNNNALMNFRAPTVQPLPSPTNKIYNCMHVGSIYSCR